MSPPWKRNGLPLTILVSFLVGLIFGSIFSTLAIAAINHIYLSVNTTGTVPLTNHLIPYVLEQGEHEVASAADNYHRSHCFYTWEVVVRALRNRSPMVEEMMSYDHVMHCRMMVLQPVRVNSTIGVEIHREYTRCAFYETWIHNLPEDEYSFRD
ncbi:hypothetical protein N7537_005491 [Penicillium hordei]|uniref:Uncharacterized protein n=1 Tax=Penicillium hordei TaxID=40994 RepID=A0AAD6E5S2_9EURO|nr:uncharacterized protein N7537_005491 [Penicillium hordei]KAJ5602535.1 hypothetical protein N7537_005491 [Penicillium hordei]